MKNLIGKGMDLLWQRDDLEKYKLDDFELLPPIMRLFFYYYNLGSDDFVHSNILKEEMLNIPMHGRYINCFIFNTLWFEGKYYEGAKYDNTLGEICKYDEIKNSFDDYEKGIREIDKEGFLLIGYMTAYGDWLMLGIEDENRDQIFIYGSSFDSIQKIADNIFELFSMVKRYWEDEKIIECTEGKYSGKDAYREWGETEWRLRGLEPEPREEWENDLSIPIKSGLGLLKQRREYPEKMDSVLEKFPFRAKLFYKYYNTGTYDEMINNVPFELQLPDGSMGSVVEDIWWENIKYKETDKEFYRIIFKNKFIRLYTFEELEEEIERYKRKTDSMHLDRYINIGEMEANVKILLGISGLSKDKVSLYKSGIGSVSFDDIFDFFTHINRYWSDKDIVQATNGAKKGKDLYQRWGENFWRVKE